MSLEQRFERWQRKHPEYADRLSETQAMTQRLEAELCESIGVRPKAVERLRWVEMPLTRAAWESAAGAQEGPTALATRLGTGPTAAA